MGTWRVRVEGKDREGVIVRMIEWFYAVLAAGRAMGGRESGFEMEVNASWCPENIQELETHASLDLRGLFYRSTVIKKEAAKESKRQKQSWIRFVRAKFQRSGRLNWKWGNIRW